MKSLRNVFLLPNPGKDRALAVTRAAAKVLSDAGATVWIDEKYRDDLGGAALLCKDFPESADLILVVGGDGSVLDASVIALERDLPILGLNLGKIGYLSEIEPEDLSSLTALLSGEYRVDEKTLLSADRLRGGEIVEESRRLALNDIVISHENYLGIADFLLSDGCGSVHYRADGLILSTPAGSTAYSLSAGGPIVSHKVEAILVTPVCPHSFFNRSILFPTSDPIAVQNACAENLRVSVDGRHFTDLLPGETCRVRASERKIRFITLHSGDMFAALFKKMKRMEENQ